MSDAFSPPPVPDEPIQPAASPTFTSQPNRGNVPMAVVAGLVAAAIGAILWAVITAATHYQIGFMAVGIGILVGLAVQRFGKGMTPIFGLIGAVCALLGCMAGNVLTTCYFIANENGTTTLTVLQGVIASGNLVTLITETFEGMDLLFYGIAVYEGFKISFTPAQ